jgi:hypothetical protein
MKTGDPRVKLGWKAGKNSKRTPFKKRGKKERVSFGIILIF